MKSKMNKKTRSSVISLKTKAKTKNHKDNTIKPKKITAKLLMDNENFGSIVFS